MEQFEAKRKQLISQVGISWQHRSWPPVAWHFQGQIQFRLFSGHDDHRSRDSIRAGRSLMSDFDRVRSRRDVWNVKIAVVIGHRKIWIIQDTNIGGFPWVLATLHRYK